ncbi:zinc finger protein 865-like isoform X2 [Lepisosteus oculatus]|uniref:zinc finger protein 865-like isoform X2 n=1 Tax=Lepisosteus oculatus TaxID=7918 RepID=UPI003719E902
MLGLGDAVTCCAPHCPNSARPPGGAPDPLLHPFPPRGSRLFQLWEGMVGRAPLPPQPRLCSLHFTPDQWEARRRDAGLGPARRRLKKSALPSRFFDSDGEEYEMVPITVPDSPEEDSTRAAGLDDSPADCEPAAPQGSGVLAPADDGDPRTGLASQSAPGRSVPGDDTHHEPSSPQGSGLLAADDGDIWSELDELLSPQSQMLADGEDSRALDPESWPSKSLSPWLLAPADDIWTELDELFSRQSQMFAEDEDSGTTDPEVGPGESSSVRPDCEPASPRGSGVLSAARADEPRLGPDPPSAPQGQAGAEDRKHCAARTADPEERPGETSLAHPDCEPDSGVRQPASDGEDAKMSPDQTSPDRTTAAGTEHYTSTDSPPGAPDSGGPRGGRTPAKDRARKTSRLRCHFCGATFPRAHHLGSHLRAHRALPLRCGLCGLQAPSYWKLNLHLEQHGAGPGAEAEVTSSARPAAPARSPAGSPRSRSRSPAEGVPQRASADSSTEPARARSRGAPRGLAGSLAGKKGAHGCHFCGATFSKAENLGSHLRAHRALPLRCEHCGLRAPSLWKLNQHLQGPQTGGPPPSGGRRAACSAGAEAQPWAAPERRASAGERGASGDLPGNSAPRKAGCRCHFCGAVFSRAENLGSHLRAHRALPLGCELCGLRAPSLWKLNQHLLTHGADEPLPAGAGTGTPQAGRPSGPQRQTGAAPRGLAGRPPEEADSSTRAPGLANGGPARKRASARCNFCGAGHSSPLGLRAHLQVHRALPLLCRRCGFEAGDHWGLNRHLRRHRKGESLPSGAADSTGPRARPPEAALSCPDCGRAFRTPFWLAMHSQAHLPSWQEAQKRALIRRKAASGGGSPILLGSFSVLNRVPLFRSGAPESQERGPMSFPPDAPPPQPRHPENELGRPGGRTEAPAAPTPPETPEPDGFSTHDPRSSTETSRPPPRESSPPQDPEAQAPGKILLLDPGFLGRPDQPAPGGHAFVKQAYLSERERASAAPLTPLGDSGTDDPPDRSGPREPAGSSGRAAPRAPARRPCPDCGALFTVPCSLALHWRRRPRRPRRHACWCGLSCPGLLRLLRHQLAHVRDANYICCGCGQAVRGGARLVRHWRRHGPPGAPLTCVCGVAFKRISSFVWHLLRNAGGSPGGPGQGTPFLANQR